MGKKTDPIEATVETRSLWQKGCDCEQEVPSVYPEVVIDTAAGTETIRANWTVTLKCPRCRRPWKWVS